MAASEHRAPGRFDATYQTCDQPTRGRWRGGYVPEPDSGYPVLWTSRSSNRKTGNIPSMAVGDSREASFASCEGCPLLKPEHGGQATPDRPMCYAQYGTPGMAHGSQVRARRAGRAPRTLRQVLGAASDEARALRLGTVGDPGVLALAYLDYVFEQARAANLAVLGYTHRWRARPELAGRLLASVESDEDTHAAAAEGFRVARILPKTHTGARWTTEDGTISGIVCPAQRTKSVTCNDCRLCDASNRSGPHIGFIDHSPRRKKA